MGVGSALLQSMVDSTRFSRESDLPSHLENSWTCLWNQCCAVRLFAFFVISSSERIDELHLCAFLTKRPHHFPCLNRLVPVTALLSLSHCISFFLFVYVNKTLLWVLWT